MNANNTSSRKNSGEEAVMILAKNCGHRGGEIPQEVRAHIGAMSNAIVSYSKVKKLRRRLERIDSALAMGYIENEKSIKEKRLYVLERLQVEEESNKKALAEAKRIEDQCHASGQDYGGYQFW